MKTTLALLGSLAFIISATAKEAVKKTHSTVPGPYPSIIQIPPPGEPRVEPSKHLIQSELSGLDVQFLQTTDQTGTEQLALADLAKNKSASEQIKAVAETVASTQVTESKEVIRLAATKQLTLRARSAKAWVDQMTTLEGGKFEKAWIERLIAVNESSAAAYELGAKSGDADIRSFAEKMLPVAKARLQMANRLGGRSVATKPEPPVVPNAAEPQPIPPTIAPIPAKP